MNKYHYEKEMRSMKWNFVIAFLIFLVIGLTGCHDMNGPPPSTPPVPPSPPPVVEQRIMSILWMGDEKWVDEYGGTHIVGFCERATPEWYADSHPVKLIRYFKTDDINYIRREVRKWKDDPNNGGYWLISGHEPDITGGDTDIPGSIKANKKLRREQYKAIREEDPDKWNHPVVIFYDMTSSNLPGFPGWELAFPFPEEGVDCDIFIIDCYANNEDGSVNYGGMTAGSRLVEIGKSRSKAQFIPNLGACYMDGAKPASLIDQWKWWKEKYPETKAVCFWNSGTGSVAIGIYEDDYLAEQAKEINRRLGLLE